MRDWYERWIENPVARQIAASMRNEAANWACSGLYALRHTSGLEVWTGNGWWFCGVEKPVRLKLGLVGRTRVWLAAKRIIRDIEWDRRDAAKANIPQMLPPA